MCCINPDEAMAKTPECVQLIGSLNTEENILLMHLQAWGEAIKSILVKKPVYFLL
jgi:hypothetical protein